MIPFLRMEVLRNWAGQWHRHSAAILLQMRRLAASALGFLLLVFSASPAWADEQTERRLLMGLKLFPALVAADRDLADKRSETGHLEVVLLYRDDVVAADNAADRLAATERIKSLPLHVGTLPYMRLAELKSNPPAALFIAEWSPDDLPNVVRFGIEHQRIIFSPFKGDVGAGVTTGIFISDRMLPLVNRETIGASGIRLQQFLLDVAKTHE